MLEQLPELRDALTKGVNWRKVADAQLADALNDSEEEKRALAQMLASMFDMEGLEDMIEAVNGGGGAKPKKMTYFLEVTISDDSGADAAKIVAESADGELADQARR